jgi:hypothetical protein
VPRGRRASTSAAVRRGKACSWSLAARAVIVGWIVGGGDRTRRTPGGRPACTGCAAAVRALPEHRPAHAPRSVRGGRVPAPSAKCRPRAPRTCPGWDGRSSAIRSTPHEPNGAVGRPPSARCRGGTPALA